MAFKARRCHIPITKSDADRFLMSYRKVQKRFSEVVSLAPFAYWPESTYCCLKLNCLTSAVTGEPLDEFKSE